MEIILLKHTINAHNSFLLVFRLKGMYYLPFLPTVNVFTASMGYAWSSVFILRNYSVLEGSLLYYSHTEKFGKVALYLLVFHNKKGLQSLERNIVSVKIWIDVNSSRFKTISIALIVVVLSKALPCNVQIWTILDIPNTVYIPGVTPKTWSITIAWYSATILGI